MTKSTAERNNQFKLSQKKRRENLKKDGRIPITVYLPGSVHVELKGMISAKGVPPKDRVTYAHVIEGLMSSKAELVKEKKRADREETRADKAERRLADQNGQDDRVEEFLRTLRLVKDRNPGLNLDNEDDLIRALLCLGYPNVHR